MRTIANKNSERGVMLPETMVAVGVLGISIAGVLTAISTGFLIVERVRENQRATQVMLEKLETLRLYNWSQINSDGFIPKTFTAKYDPLADENYKGITYQGTLTIAPFPHTSATYSDQMRQVTVTLSWVSKLNLQRSRTFVTFIAEDGLQNYVY
jgi:type II secretory pathway pseudopilin PulG